MTTALSPVKEDRRIASIDVLRGLAMLGILVLNIQTFAMPFAAYGNPLGYGTVEGADYWVFTLSMVLGDMKFMAIFSMLFGAGMVLFIERLLETGRSAYAIHYRRMAWLLVIGLLIFGRRLPEVGRSVGRSIVEFKKGVKGIEDDVDDASDKPAPQLNDQAVSREDMSVDDAAASVVKPEGQGNG